MLHYVIRIKLEGAPYQQAFEQGKPFPDLLQDLKGNIQHQLDEYDLPQLLTLLVFSHSQQDIMFSAPKKTVIRHHHPTA